MDIASLPFSQLIGLQINEPSADTLVSLPAGPQYGNHLGTVHAAALLAVAESGSGEFLLRHLGKGQSTGFVPVVRKIEARFRKPAHGAVAARCPVADEELARWSRELAERGRLSAVVPVEVHDEHGTLTLGANIEWFITRAD